MEPCRRERPPDDALIARVRELLVASLVGPSLGVEEIAASLSLSIRTLKRRLSARNQSLTSLLEELRRERALALLERGAPLEEIARGAGYNDVPSFYRAFRRWTGTTPRRYCARDELAASERTALPDRVAS